jgi:hypothetical protein
MVDRHVVKMILETAQLLSTAHRIIDGQSVTENVVNAKGKTRKKTTWKLNDGRDSVLYACTHANHPSAIWARQSRENYSWLYRHFLALGEEYSHRYGKRHLSIDKLESVLATPPHNLSATALTTMPSCMAPEYITSTDPVTNYRNYYIKGKAALHRWTKRVPPQWMTGTIILLDAKKQIHIVT